MNNVKQYRNQSLKPFNRPVLTIVMSLSFAAMLSQVAYATQVLAQPIITHSNNANNSSANTTMEINIRSVIIVTYSSLHSSTDLQQIYAISTYFTMPSVLLIRY